MKSYLKYAVPVIFVILTSFDLSDKPTPLVIVELFTAEGCSSCPAADELLKEMSDILNKENKRVVGLSFHVTYWNKLGWIDPYSDSLFTLRQKRYVSQLKLSQLYTPQAIVNGKSEFVGSNPIAFREQVTQASTESPAYEVSARIHGSENKATLAYELNKEPKHMVMNIAVVENYVEHFVPRGENQNRTLKHVNVVRSFETITPLKAGETEILLPEGLELSKAQVIVYLQNSRTFHINGATIAEK